jgi:hypothetical protein
MFRPIKYGQEILQNSSGNWTLIDRFDYTEKSSAIKELNNNYYVTINLAG